MQLNRERFSSGEVVCGSLLTHNLGSSLFRHTIQGEVFPFGSSLGKECDSYRVAQA